MKKKRNFYATGMGILSQYIDMGQPATPELITFAGIRERGGGLVDTPKVRPSGRASVRPFKTTGWVTCAVCGKQITEGWEEGRVGEQAAIHYCNAHAEDQQREED